MVASPLRHAPLAGLLLGLAACAEAPEPYSPHYSTVLMEDGSGTEAKLLVPDACLGAPADEDPAAATLMTFVPDVGPHLPPGCANAYNLLHMVESRRDVVEGRALGPAPAAPTARAAQRYLYGAEDPLGAANTNADVPAGGDGMP